MKRLVLCALCFLYSLFPIPHSLSASAAIQNVGIDENGRFVPDEANAALTNAITVVARVNLAEATAEAVLTVTESATNALGILEDALRHRTDYALVQLCATGLEDAIGEQASDGGSLSFVTDPDTGKGVAIDRSSDPDNVLVTLCYGQTGNLTTPVVNAKSALTGEWLTNVSQTAPQLVEAGSVTNIYRTVVSVPKSWGSSEAFFQVTAEIRTAVDDGKVFDVFSDSGGITGTFTVQSNATFTVRFVQGRVVRLSGSGITAGN